MSKDFSFKNTNYSSADNIKYPNINSRFERLESRNNLFQADLTNLEIPKVYFTGNITTMSGDVACDLAMSYKSKSNSFNGIANMKWQGTSSQAYPKKNFTVKLYTDSTKKTKLNKSFRNWGSQYKFCLKANYIDHSHCRNIVSAQLWSDVVATRQNIPELLASAPMHGAVDGFPIKLYMNGVYQGLYTWNIPKDGWMFNMDSSNPNHAVLCAEIHTGAGAFRQTAVIDGTDWSLEFPDNLQPVILTSFNNAINHVKDTTDAVFKANFSQYFDLEACIDYYVYAKLMCHLDGLGKNLLMITYDGVHWIPSMYDMDSTWGLYCDGQRRVSETYYMPEQYECKDSLLWERLYLNYTAEIDARYTSLRQNVLSVTNIIDKFERFTDVISKDLYAEDLTVYNGIPLGEVNNVQNIRLYVNNRATKIDGIKHLVNLLGTAGNFVADSSGDGLADGYSIIGSATNLSVSENVQTGKFAQWGGIEIVFNADVGDVIYVCAYVNPHTAIDTNISVKSDSTYNVSSYSAITVGSYNFLSTTATLTSGVHKINISNLNAASQIIDIKRLHVFNLTKVFGSTKPTKAKLDTFMQLLGDRYYTKKDYIDIV